jgi:hypothetical protein
VPPAKSAEIVPQQLEFVDIAGLVRGAARGEGSAIGLFPTFAGSTRSPTSCVALSTTTSPCRDSIDPRRRDGRDELMLADLKASNGAPCIWSSARGARRGQGNCCRRSGAGRTARRQTGARCCRKALMALQLLSAKPVLYIANVEEACTAWAMPRPSCRRIYRRPRRNRW